MQADYKMRGVSGRDLVEQGFETFQKKHRLDRVVCVNLTSTEPNLRLGAAHKSLAAFERALDQDNQKAVRPSALYAYAAGSLGLPFVHFTPSNSALTPAIDWLPHRSRRSCSHSCTTAASAFHCMSIDFNAFQCISMHHRF